MPVWITHVKHIGSWSLIKNLNNFITSNHYYHTKTIILRKIILDFLANSNEIVDEAKSNPSIEWSDEELSEIEALAEDEDEPKYSKTLVQQSPYWYKIHFLFPRPGAQPREFRKTKK